MRGFVITILSVAIIVMLVTLSMSSRNIQASTERVLMEPLPLLYAAYLLDDVGYELNSIIGPGINLNQSNDSIKLTMTDSLHDKNHSSDILAYEEFLTGEVANTTASTIATNFTNLTDGTIKLFINEDYAYSNDHDDRMILFTRSGGTGARSYEINFTITAVRSNVTQMEFNDNGTINVTIRYTDLNGTTVEQGKVLENQANSFRVEYMDGSSMTVDVGLASANNGSLRMKADGINADVSWTAILPPIDAEKKLGYEYDATISYVQNKVSKQSRIGK